MVDKISKNEKINYDILKHIFQVRSIRLEDLSLKILKEKTQFCVEFYSNELEKVFEDKIQLKNVTENIEKKDFEIKLNKKVKIFN